MKIWLTQFKAENVLTGEIKTWGGENVEAPTWELAQEWCFQNRGYLRVIGELIAEVDLDGNKIDYDVINNN